MSGIPYAQASSGSDRARGEVVRILQKFGCESVGFMDNFAMKTVILQFVYRGQQVSLEASAQGWANMYLDANPWNRRRALDEQAYKAKALYQGMIAVNCILRDWVKGQMTAVESGIARFDDLWLPYMVTHDGRTVAKRIADAGGLAKLEYLPEAEAQ